AVFLGVEQAAEKMTIGTVDFQVAEREAAPAGDGRLVGEHHRRHAKWALTVRAQGPSQLVFDEGAQFFQAVARAGAGGPGLPFEGVKPLLRALPEERQVLGGHGHESPYGKEIVLVGPACRAGPVCPGPARQAGPTNAYPNRSPAGEPDLRGLTR